MSTVLAAQGRARSSAGLRIGSLLTTGGFLAVIVLVVLNVGALLGTPESPAEGSVLSVVVGSAPSRHTIYLATARSDSGIDPGWPVSCRVTGPQGEEVPLQDSGFAIRRTTQNSSFYPRQWWEATQVGAYQVSCADGRFAVGPRFSLGGSRAGLVLPVAGAAIVIGIVVSTSSALRRRLATRDTIIAQWTSGQGAAPGMTAGYPPGGGSTPPPPPHPPQPPY